MVANSKDHVMDLCNRSINTNKLHTKYTVGYEQEVKRIANIGIDGGY